MLSFRRSRSTVDFSKQAKSTESPPTGESVSERLRDGSTALIIAESRQPQKHDNLLDSLAPDIQQRIAERAYFRWVEAGRPPCRDMDYWLTAEQEILAEVAASRRSRGGST